MTRNARSKWKKSPRERGRRSPTGGLRNIRMTYKAKAIRMIASQSRRVRPADRDRGRRDTDVGQWHPLLAARPRSNGNGIKIRTRFAERRNKAAKTNANG